MEKKKILVIDDERIVLESISRILGESGFRVDVARSGRDGLSRAISGDYDLVLTDLRMPDIGGMRVLRDIKRARPSLPVMLITGFGSVQTAVQALKLGAAEYIEKPFTPEELSTSVASALQAAAGRRPDEQGVTHKAELLRVLERAAADHKLVYDILVYGTDALDEFNLSGPEKLAILTGDINWIEKYTGPLTERQRLWLEKRQAAEVW